LNSSGCLTKVREVNKSAGLWVRPVEPGPGVVSWCCQLLRSWSLSLPDSESHIVPMACLSAWSMIAWVASLGVGAARLQRQGWAGAPLIRNGTVTMLDATPRSFRSLALMRPSLFRSGTTFGASLKMPS